MDGQQQHVSTIQVFVGVRGEQHWGAGEDCVPEPHGCHHDPAL